MWVQCCLTGIPLLAHICATFINELRASLIIFSLFVPWQRLIELFSSNHGFPHLNKACHIDELSRGSVLGLKFSLTTSDRNAPYLLCKSCFFLVFSVFSTNPSTMAAAGAIWHRHSPDANGGIQWLQVKPWMCSIGRCALGHTATSAWQSKLPAICLHFLLLPIRCCPLT